MGMTVRGWGAQAGAAEDGGGGDCFAHRTGLTAYSQLISTHTRARLLSSPPPKVHKLLLGATLVGHSLNNDLKALLLDHPRKDTRDTGK